MVGWHHSVRSLGCSQFYGKFYFFLLEWFNKKDRVDALTVGLEKTKVFRLFITFL